MNIHERFAQVYFFFFLSPGEISSPANRDTRVVHFFFLFRHWQIRQPLSQDYWASLSLSLSLSLSVPVIAADFNDPRCNCWTTQRLHFSRSDNPIVVGTIRDNYAHNVVRENIVVDDNASVLLLDWHYRSILTHRPPLSSRRFLAKSRKRRREFNYYQPSDPLGKWLNFLGATSVST